MKKVLVFTAAAELVTGLALTIEPALVIRLLLGAEATGVALVAGRCFGIGLLALGLAWWPAGPGAGSRSSAVLSALAYNALIALYLGYLGTGGHMEGTLLWPAVALHAAVALVLAGKARRTASPG